MHDKVELADESGEVHHQLDQLILLQKQILAAQEKILSQDFSSGDASNEQGILSCEKELYTEERIAQAEIAYSQAQSLINNALSMGCKRQCRFSKIFTYDELISALCRNVRIIQCCESSGNFNAAFSTLTL